MRLSPKRDRNVKTPKAATVVERTQAIINESIHPIPPSSLSYLSAFLNVRVPTLIPVECLLHSTLLTWLFSKPAVM